MLKMECFEKTINHQENKYLLDFGHCSGTVVDMAFFAD